MNLLKIFFGYIVVAFFALLPSGKQISRNNINIIKNIDHPFKILKMQLSKLVELHLLPLPLNHFLYLLDTFGVLQS